MTLRELSRDEQRTLTTENSIAVVEVSGIAAKSGIASGDLIIAINSKRVKNIRELGDALKSANKRAAILVQRGESMMFIPLKY